METIILVDLMGQGACRSHDKYSCHIKSRTKFDDILFANETLNLNN